MRTAQVEAYFTKYDYIKGEYKPTELDRTKKAADFRITAADDLYTVEFNHPAEVRTGRSIRPASRPGVYYVTEKGLEMLKRRYTAVCDF